MSVNPSLRLDEPLLIDEIIKEQSPQPEVEQQQQQQQQSNSAAKVNVQKKFSSQDFPPLSASSTYKPVTVQWGKNIKPVVSNNNVSFASGSASTSTSTSTSTGVSDSPSPPQTAKISSTSFPSLSSISPSPVFSSVNGSSGSPSSFVSGSGLSKNKKIQESFSLDSATQLNITKPELSKIVLSVKSTYKVSIESTLGRNGRTFLISGLPSDVAFARRDLVKKLTKPVSIQFTIPTKTKSAVIGQSGKTIKQIIETYNVKIDVENENLGPESYDEDLDDTLSNVTINGDLESVQHAKSQILDIINESIKTLTIRIPIKENLLPFIDLNQMNIVENVDAKIFNRDESIIFLTGDREFVKASKLNVLDFLQKLDGEIIEKTVPVLRKLQFTINQKDIKENFQVLVTFLNDSAIFSGTLKNVDNAIEYARNISKKYILETLEISKAHNKNLEHAKNLGLFFYTYQTSILSKFSETFPNVQLRFMNPEQLQTMDIVTFNLSSMSDYQNELKAAKKYLIQTVTNLTPSRVLVVNDLDYEIFGKEIKKILNAERESISFVQNGDYYKTNKDDLLLICDKDNKGQSEEDDDDDDFDFKPTDEEYITKLNEINQKLDVLRKKQDSLFTEVLEISSEKQTNIFIKSKQTEKLILEDVENLQIKLNSPSANELTLRGEEKSVKHVVKTIKHICENSDLQNTIVFEVPTKIVARLIGNKGASLNQTRDQYGVSIDIEQTTAQKDETTKITLVGLQYNAELCKHHLLAESKKWADVITKELVVPSKYKGSLIGSQGVNIKKLIEKYNVSIDVQDNGDFVFIKGPSRGVNKCFEEMNQLLDFITDNSHTIVKKIALKYVPRIIGKGGRTINDIKDEFGVQLDFQETSEQAAKKGLEEIDLQITGTKQSIKEAESKINEIIKNVDDFVQKNLEIESKYFKFIVGPNGSVLREIMHKTGGDLILDGPKPVNVPNANDEGEPITIQGPKKIVEKIAAEIEKIVEGVKNRVVVELDVSKERYGALIGPGGFTLRELEETFNVSLDIPKKTDPADKKVKITGLQANVDKCSAKIINDIIGSTDNVDIKIPAQYHAFVSQHGAFIKSLSADLHVFVRHGDRGNQAFSLVRNDFTNLNIPVEEIKQDGKKINTLIKEVEDCEVSETQTGLIPWKLTYETIDFSELLGETDNSSTKEDKPKESKKEILAKATELIENRLELAKQPQFYGYVYSSKPSNFSKVMGFGGSEINLIRKLSGAIIEIPKKSDKINDIIVIKGTREIVEKAIELITKKLSN